MRKRRFTNEYELGVIMPYYKQHGYKKTRGEFNIGSRLLFDIRERHNIEINGYPTGKSHHNYKPKVEIICKYCGKHKERFPSAVRENTFCSEKCMGLWTRENWIGENNPNYQNGKRAGYFYNTAEYREVREQAFILDNYQCRQCKSKIDIQPHHIKNANKYPELKYDINNVITLCNHCHSKIAWHEGEFEDYFYELIKQRGN